MFNKILISLTVGLLWCGNACALSLQQALLAASNAATGASTTLLGQKVIELAGEAANGVRGHVGRGVCSSAGGRAA